MTMNAKTEEQARTKWCPLRESAGCFNFNCIASECMMWDWKGLREASGNERTGFTPINLVRDGRLNTGEVGIGDCGLKRGQP